METKVLNPEAFHNQGRVARLLREPISGECACWCLPPVFDLIDYHDLKPDDKVWSKSKKDWVEAFVSSLSELEANGN